MIGHGESEREARIELGTDDAAIESLREAVGGDEAEATGLPGEREQRGLVPPVGDEIGGFGHVGPCASQGFDIAIAQGAAHGGGANEGRVPHHEIRLWPVGATRVLVALLRHAGGFVGHLFAGDRVGFGAEAIPAGDRLAVCIEYKIHPIKGEHGVAAFDVVEIAQHRLGRADVAVGAEVPLQVADPQHGFGDAGGAGVEFEAEELVRVDRDAFHLQQALRFAEFFQRAEHFAFEALHVLQGDVQKVAAAAGGIEHAHAAELVVESAQGVDGILVFALRIKQGGGGLGVFPVGTQGLDHGGQHQALDIGARGVVGAEGVALGGVQRALQQGAEDGGLDEAPVGTRGFAQELDLVFIQRQYAGVGKQATIEAQHAGTDGGGEGVAVVHVLPQTAHQRHEGGGVLLAFLQQGFEALGGQQAHIFREHGEERAHQEAGDGVRWLPAGLQTLGKQGKLGGDLAGDAGGLARGVERERIEPDLSEAFADFFATQVFKGNAMAARIRKRRVGGAGARELGIQLDVATDVGDDQKRRAALGGGQRAGVALGLAAGAEHGVVPPAGA